jgi:hypothetical protein
MDKKSLSSKTGTRMAGRYVSAGIATIKKEVITTHSSQSIAPARIPVKANDPNSRLKRFLRGKSYVLVVPQGREWVALDEVKKEVCDRSGDKFNVVQCASEYAARKNKALYVMGNNSRLYFGGEIKTGIDDMLAESIHRRNK